MRRLPLFFILLFVGGLLSNQAQADRFKYFWDTKAHDRGQIHFSYGYGFPRLPGKIFDFNKDENEFRKVGVGPFLFKAEYGLTRQLSIGLSASYIEYTSDWQEQRYDEFHQRNLWFTYGTKLQDIAVMLRLNYHWVISPRAELYMGGGMGYNHWIEEDILPGRSDDSLFNSNFKTPGAFASEITLGYRYYLRKRTALYLEMGYGKSIIQGGFVFKFRHRRRE